MADLSDVEEAIASVVLNSLYPDGPVAPSTVGAVCRIYRGWPTSNGLNADLAAGDVNVTISPDGDPGTTIPHRNIRWYTSAGPATLTATVSGGTITLVGTVQVGQLVGLCIDNRSFVMTPGKDDSVDTVAAALAAAIRQERSALSVGPVITVPDARSILARVVMSGTMHSEIRRQERDIRVIFWCPNPTLRDLVSREVDLGLAQHPFLELPDGSSARITYKGTVVFDQAQNAQLYRRDLIMTADYPTVLVETQPPMLFGALELNAMDVIA